MTIVISVENLSKTYRLGQIGTGTFASDLSIWWARMRGRPNPLLKIGEQDYGNRDGEDLWALRGVSFTVDQGEVLGIIGRNGAGKSTLLKILSRVTAPTSGKIKVKGRIASLLEVGTGFHPELTGRENVYLNGAILGMNRDEITRKFDEIVDFSEVEKFIDTPVKRYSSGMYVRLAFAVAAHLDPEILVVDEVLAVGDVSFQKKCLGKMGEVANEGRTVLFVSHNMTAIQKLCQSTVLFSKGLISFMGNTQIAVGKYLQGVIVNDAMGVPLHDRTNRSGNGKVRLTGFRMEDTGGNLLQILQTGQDVAFIFTFECAPSIIAKNVDVGFSFDTELKECAFNLYSSYVGQVFPELPQKGEFRCIVNKIAISPGRYYISARILISGEEADWPHDFICSVDVVPGDFYGSGKKGYIRNSYFLVSGDWDILPMA